ncbi:MAG TPA: FkbM family methyltransferase [Chitinophagaceae bacterium]|nr:FkbM family methyltransferase [Chitinophagaceae bacterium]
MAKLAANIVKGIVKRLGRTRTTGRYPRLPWLQEKLLKHQDDQAEKQISLHRLRLHYKRPYEVIHTYRELFERELYAFPATCEDPVIIDCGSNIGLSVLFFKSQYPGARVLAFEPDPSNFALLEKNIAANGLQQVTAYRKAVWIRDGSIHFEASESEASHIREDGGSGTPVACIRLATLLAGLERIDFLKMDIEGAESEVLEDCAGQLGRIGHLFIEYHGKAGETEKLSRMLQLFAGLGFRVYVKNAADSLPHPFLEKQTGTLYDVQLNLFCYR